MNAGTSPAIRQVDVILFDCDGVLLDSNRIKGEAFYFVVRQYFSDEAAVFLQDFHLKNGGLSRQAKFQKLLEQFKPHDQNVTVDGLCHAFAAEVAKKILICPTSANLESILQGFLGRHKNLIVLSATPQAELKDIMDRRQLSRFFDQILGSPTTKIDHIKQLHDRNVLSSNRPFVFIGDSHHDQAAAEYFDNCIFYWSSEFAPAPSQVPGGRTISTLATLSQLQSLIN